jgi:hypothetical protein
MPWTTRSTRFLIAVAAASCGALLVPAAALAAPAAPAAVRAAAPVPRCTSGHTLVWLGIPGSGAAGSTFYPLQFTNVGHTACRLFGYPGVSAVRGSGKQIGPAASHSGKRRVVTLSPGATAHAVLRIVQASFISGCDFRTAAGLRIFPPGQASAQTISGFTFRTCTNKRVLSVSAVRSGVGVP